MSDETKRDVFEAVLNRLAGYQVFFNGWPRETLDDYKKRYSAALPDDLPVIPRAVGKYIKTNRGHMSLTSGIENAICISEWLWGKGFDYGNDSVFARAWVLGVWRVEETGEIVKLEAEK
ncbi:MAG: hypothetical protein ACLUSE_07580 [Lacticaseibacillus rhamnosus]